MKQCRDCQQFKNQDEFPFSVQKGGLAPNCKECRIIIIKNKKAKEKANFIKNAPILRGEWRMVKNHPEYEVNEYGDLRRSKIARRLPLRLLAPANGKDGYPMYCLSKNYINKNFYAHRLVAIAFLGDKPTPDSQVRHLDGNVKNNHVSNLVWGTAKENAADRCLHGTQILGEDNHNAKLKEKDIPIIRKRMLKESNKKISEDYKVSSHTIYAIRIGKTWGWL